MENQVPVIAGLLDRWLTADSASLPPTPELAEALDRLIHATQVRYPLIGDIARNVRFKLFDAPAIDAVREHTFNSVRGNLAYLAEAADAPDHARRTDALVDCSRATGRPTGGVSRIRERSSRWSPGSTTEFTHSTTSRPSTVPIVPSSPAPPPRRRPHSPGVRHLPRRRTCDDTRIRRRARRRRRAEHVSVDLYLSWPDAPP